MTVISIHSSERHFSAGRGGLLNKLFSFSILNFSIPGLYGMQRFTHSPLLVLFFCDTNMGHHQCSQGASPLVSLCLQLFLEDLPLLSPPEHSKHFVYKDEDSLV